MAKQTESTAVNALIDLVSRGGPQELPSDDLFAIAPQLKPQPLPRARTPQGTDRNVPVVPAFATARVRTAMSPRAESIPPLNRRVIRQPAFDVREEVPAPPERPSMQTTTLPVALPSAAPYERTPRDSDPQYVGRDRVAPAREGTQQITRPTRLDPRRVVIPMVLFFIVGGAIGGYIAVKQRRSNNAVAVARLTPDAGPVVMVQPQEPTPPPPSDMLIRTPAAFTEVRIDTVPYGASVTLVDNGTQMPLGTTPLAATVETSRQYELLIEHPKFPTQTIALDPQATKHINIPLQAAAPVTAVAKVEAPVLTAPVATTAKTKPTPAPAPVQAPKTKRPAPLEKAREPVAAATGGEGTLMISAKPPCEISVDGKATGLTTPQRAISLSAGSHKVTLTNTTAGIRETFAVKITPGAPTKVIRDLMPR